MAEVCDRVALPLFQLKTRCGSKDPVHTGVRVFFIRLLMDEQLTTMDSYGQTDLRKPLFTSVFSPDSLQVRFLNGTSLHFFFHLKIEADEKWMYTDEKLI